MFFLSYCFIKDATEAMTVTLEVKVTVSDQHGDFIYVMYSVKSCSENYWRILQNQGILSAILFLVHLLYSMYMNILIWNWNINLYSMN